MVFTATAVLILIEIGKYGERIEECSIEIEEKIIRGNSLTGLVEDGEKIIALFGYYDCYEVQKQDIILYSYAGNKEPLIKIVEAIPGDKLSLQETINGWHILINGQVLKNSENKPYLLNQKRHKMLSLYEKSYQGKVPEESFLIMSNLIGGGMDSTSFGLIHQDDILGKATK